MYHLLIFFNTHVLGVLNMKFQLSDQPHYGTWKVRCYAFVSVYSFVSINICKILTISFSIFADDRLISKLKLLYSRMKPYDLICMYM